MKKIVFMVNILVAFGLHAITEDVDGVQWMYEFRGEDVVCFGTWLQKYSKLTVPSILGKRKVTMIGAHAFKDNAILEEIIIPNGVTNINEKAFYNCAALKKVTIPNSVETASSAFFSCAAIRQIVIPAHLRTQVVFPSAYSLVEYAEVNDGEEVLCDHLFDGCGGLLDVKLPKSITEIGKNAFYFCRKLPKVVLPTSLLKIADFAFYGCDGLEEIELPDSLTELGLSAFSGCKKLSSVVVPQVLLKIGGAAFDSCESLESAVLPNGLSVIPNSMFYGCSSLKEVVFPSGLKTVGAYAFAGTALSAITLPESTEVIEAGAFFDSKVEDIELPKGLTSIGAWTFSNCTLLKSISIPDNIEEIGTRTFYNCKKLKAIHLSAKLKTIGDEAFRLCSELETIDIPGSVSVIPSYAFFECRSLKSVVLHEGTHTLKEYCFYCCTPLTDLILPSTIRIIEYGAFSLCDLARSGGVVNVNGCVIGYSGYAKSLVLSEDIHVVGDGVFANSSFESITLSSQIKRVGSKMFKSCSQLKRIVIPNGVEEIGDEAFSGCIELWDVKIPSSVLSIANSSFVSCSKIRTITLPGRFAVPVVFSNSVRRVSSAQIAEGSRELCENAFEGCESLTSIEFCEGVTNIAARAFYECRSLRMIDIPDSVASLGDHCFEGCSALNGLVLPENLINIGDYCFANCSALSDVAMPKSVLRVGNNAFRFCSNLKEIFVPAVEIGDFAFYECSNLGAIEVTSNLTTIGANAFWGCHKDSFGYFDVHVPSAINWFNVDFVEEPFHRRYRLFEDGVQVVSFSVPEWISAIKPYAFSYLNEVSVYLHEGIISIGEGAFCNSTITSLNIPTTVNTIGKFAFKNLSSLTEVVIPDGVRIIEDSTFEGAYNLTNVVFPKNLVEIGCSAFLGCTKLTVVELPSKLKKLGARAFYNTSISSCEIPSGVETLRNETFYNSSSLKTVVLNEGLEVIESNAFGNCSLDGHVRIPSTVSVIQDHAFIYNQKLSAAEFLGDPPVCGVTPFSSVAADFCVYAKWGAPAWKGFVEAGKWNGYPVKWLDPRVEDVFKNFGGGEWSSGGDESWIGTLEDNHGVARSGVIGDLGLSWMECSVEGPFKLRFYWRTSCESYGTLKVDYATFCVDGVEKKWLAGDSAWNIVEVSSPESGSHVLRWAYQKDEDGRAGEDCVWVKDVHIQTSRCAAFYADEEKRVLVEKLFAFEGESVEIPCCTQTKEKYSFIGWRRDDGSVARPGDELQLIQNEEYVAIWEKKILPAPIIRVDSTFTTESTEVVISGSIAQSYILYTIDGTDPLESGTLYSGPFEVSSTCTIRAVCVGVGYFNSEEAMPVETYRYPWTIAECVNNASLIFETGGDKVWQRDLKESHDGVACIKSGAVHDSAVSWITTTVNGSGVLSFWVRVSSEAYKKYKLDFLSVSVDDVEMYWGGGEIGWTNVTLRLDGGGQHVVKWAYSKNELTSSGQDCAWIDEVVWNSDANIPMLPSTATADDIRLVLRGFSDVALVNNIKSVELYTEFRTWALGIGVAEVRSSLCSWQSFALGQSCLLKTNISDSDLTIVSFSQTSKIGFFDFSVKIKEVNVGEGADPENLKHLFEVEGSASINENDFSVKNVSAQFSAPKNGVIRFVASPNDLKATSFFMRIKVR